MAGPDRPRGATWARRTWADRTWARLASTMRPTGRASGDRRAASTGWLVTAGEALVAFATALIMLLLSHSIDIDPIDRIGQVSGLAGLDLRFLVLGLLVVVACVVMGRLGGRPWEITSGYACAAVAGLVTGLVAGGVLVALSGTSWPLFADGGDSGQLAIWADDVIAGRPTPDNYPPVVFHLLAWLSELTGSTTSGALRSVHIVGTALFGPIAYLAWRLLLAPAWALAVTLVAALPLLEPYKPYTTIVLVALVPVLIGLLSELRRAADRSLRRIALVGLGAGAALGLLFVTYSGWFVWSAPGAIVAALIVFPWRTAPGRGAALLGLAVLALVAVANRHLFGLLASGGTVKDRYFYFDTDVDPAYIAMWRNDLPGNVGPWPPPGELAGVGVFTVLLVVGLALAVAFGAARTTVITLGTLLAGAWLLRLWFASQMFATGTVQLYPRTTPEILYCLLLLSIFAVRYGLRRAAGPLAALTGRDDERAVRPARVAVTIGAICAALLFGMSAGSATADRFMPRNDGSAGLLTYVAHNVRQLDGTCPQHSTGACADSVTELLERGRPGGS